MNTLKSFIETLTQKDFVYKMHFSKIWYFDLFFPAWRGLRFTDKVTMLKNFFFPRHWRSGKMSLSVFPSLSYFAATSVTNKKKFISLTPASHTPPTWSSGPWSGTCPSSASITPLLRTPLILGLWRRFSMLMHGGFNFHQVNPPETIFLSRLPAYRVELRCSSSY